MNRVLTGYNGVAEIMPLGDKQAFNKGIEWFTEIVFFYGVLFALAFYEMDKFEKAKS